MKKAIGILFTWVLCLSMALSAGAEEGKVLSATKGGEAFTVGSTVTFGSYEQDNDLSNGKEPLNWIVLEIRDHQALMITQYCIDAGAYHTAFIPMTWACCARRAWLNDTFLHEAFSDEEMSKIVAVVNVNADNPYYSTPGGDDTTDKVFFLSLDEALKYFPEQADRKVSSTAYAEAQGAYVNAKTGFSWWWLRTSGVRNIDVCGVGADGRISGYGSRDVNRPSGAIRPALWVSVEE